MNLHYSKDVDFTEILLKSHKRVKFQNVHTVPYYQWVAYEIMFVQNVYGFVYNYVLNSKKQKKGISKEYQ